MTITLENPHTVMGRVTALLEPFRDTEGLTLSELSRRTGFPRSSAHRMLLQLVAVGLVRRSGTTYRLGPKLVELGALAVTHDRVHQAALQTMYDLQHDTRLVVHLAVLEGDSLLYLEKIGGRWSTNLHTRAGERQPVTESVEGAATLAFRDGHDEVACSGGSVRCIAAAFDAGRGEIAVLSLTGPYEQFSEATTRRIRAAAEAITAQLTRFPHH